MRVLMFCIRVESRRSEITYVMAYKQPSSEGLTETPTISTESSPESGRPNVGEPCRASPNSCNRRVFAVLGSVNSKTHNM